MNENQQVQKVNTFVKSFRDIVKLQVSLKSRNIIERIKEKQKTNESDGHLENTHFQGEQYQDQIMNEQQQQYSQQEVTKDKFREPYANQNKVKNFLFETPNTLLNLSKQKYERLIKGFQNRIDQQRVSKTDSRINTFNGIANTILNHHNSTWNNFKIIIQIKINLQLDKNKVKALLQDQNILVDIIQDKIIQDQNILVEMVQDNTVYDNTIQDNTVFDQNTKIKVIQDKNTLSDLIQDSIIQDQFTFTDLRQENIVQSIIEQSNVLDDRLFGSAMLIDDHNTLQYSSQCQSPDAEWMDQDKIRMEGLNNFEYSRQVVYQEQGRMYFAPNSNNKPQSNETLGNQEYSQINFDLPIRDCISNETSRVQVGPEIQQIEEVDLTSIIRVKTAQEDVTETSQIIHLMQDEVIEKQQQYTQRQNIKQIQQELMQVNQEIQELRVFRQQSDRQNNRKQYLGRAQVKNIIKVSDDQNALSKANDLVQRMNQGRRERRLRQARDHSRIELNFREEIQLLRDEQQGVLNQMEMKRKQRIQLRIVDQRRKQIEFSQMQQINQQFIKELLTEGPQAGQLARKLDDNISRIRGEPLQRKMTINGSIIHLPLVKNKREQNIQSKQALQVRLPQISPKGNNEKQVNQDQGDIERSMIEKYMQSRQQLISIHGSNCQSN